MSNLLQGRKTYIGLAITLVGILGLGKYITGPETDTALNSIFELVGVAIAIYGRVKAKPRVE